jgi:glycosyltransferase involved in cell wall biosynthesis
MSKFKKLKISVVIPVYNEAENINACLDALSAQKLPVHEVIVVDNNSTDFTSSVVKEHKFVKLVNESRQGVGYARDTGFMIATGDILARLDADSIVSNDWSSKIIDCFKTNNYQAITGSVSYYGFRFNKLASKFDLLVRRIANFFMPSMPFLLGSNMAMTKGAWLNVKDNLCMSRRIHEDIDLAIHLHRQGYKIGFSKILKSQISSRRYHSNSRDLTSYCLALPRTYLLHDSLYFIPCLRLAITTLSLYLPARKIIQLLKPIRATAHEVRVDPTANVV